MNIIGVIVSTLVAFSIAVWLGSIAITALRTGVARIAGGKEFKRRKNRFAYWITVFVQFCFTLMFLAVGAIRLTKLRW
jgi:hypothetical protein